MERQDKHHIVKNFNFYIGFCIVGLWILYFKVVFFVVDSFSNFSLSMGNVAKKRNLHQFNSQITNDGCLNF